MLVYEASCEQWQQIGHQSVALYTDFLDSIPTAIREESNLEP